ncbi:MAG: DUF3572 domain-containing protein [Xanthobacteraceae bacterium]
MKTPTIAVQEAAEMLAIQALAFLAEEPARLNGFLSTTGLELGGLRAAAREPRFLAGVLDHMLSDESLLVAFAEGAGIDPAGIEKARRALGGHWERDLP